MVAGNASHGIVQEGHLGSPALSQSRLRLLSYRLVHGPSYPRGHEGHQSRADGWTRQYVEADSSYIGGKEKNKHVGKRNRKNIGGAGKQIAHTLVERSGMARSERVANISGKTLRPIIVKHVSRKSILMTDTGGEYMALGKEFARHETVDHSKDEYVRAEAHSNTVEGYFAILKRGVIGTFHHVSEAHLPRYLAEFDFRYNRRTALGWTDTERAKAIAEGIEGKRLTYRRAGQAAN